MISGRAFLVTVGPHETVGDLKAKIDDITDIRPECQLISSGGALLQNYLIAMKHIRPLSTINLVVREILQISQSDYMRYNRKLAMETFRI